MGEQSSYGWSFGGRNSSESAFSSSNIGEGSLHDIFQVLSEVPLHATDQTLLHDICPPQNLEVLECSSAACTVCSTSSIMKDKALLVGAKNQEMGSHENIMISEVAQEGQSKGVAVEPDQPTSAQNHDHDHHHIPTRRRSREQKRRERINAKLRALQALIPISDKGDHASILDNAINYIKSLKLHVEMLSTAWSSIGQCDQFQQAPYMTPPPVMPMITGPGSFTPPWPPMTTPPLYRPIRITPPILAPRTTAPPLLKPSNAPINSWRPR